MIDQKDISFIIEHLKDELLPIGVILIFPSEKVPHGFIPCDGREMSKKNFPELYELIRGTWGETTTSFFLPDLQGQFVRGWDKDGDIDPGRKIGSTQPDSLQGHSHDFCVSAMKLEDSGQHDHDLYWGKFNMRDASVNSMNNHEQFLALQYAQSSDSLYDRIGTDCTRKDGSSLEGTHSHKILIDESQQIISEPTDSIHGHVANKIANETRPKNVALMFCIKVK